MIQAEEHGDVASVGPGRHYPAWSTVPTECYKAGSSNLTWNSRLETSMICPWNTVSLALSLGPWAFLVPSAGKTDVGLYTSFTTGDSWEDWPSVSGFESKVSCEGLKLRYDQWYLQWRHLQGARPLLAQRSKSSEMGQMLNAPVFPYRQLKWAERDDCCIGTPS